MRERGFKKTFLLRKKELKKDKKRLLKKIKKLEKKLENERNKKDELYEKILGTLSNKMMLQSNEKAKNSRD